jgi:nitroreductase
MVAQVIFGDGMIAGLIKQNRSCRRFHQRHLLDLSTLKGLVDLARLSASAANLQPLKYVLSCDVKKNAIIFQELKWAGYLRDWPGPAEGERPSAYIIMLVDARNANQWVGYDAGIASQSILLGARERGLAGCMIGAINRKALANQLNISGQYKILLVIAIGKPREKAVIEEVAGDDDIRYWRDDKDVHHVPKKRLDDIIVNAYE